MLSSQKRKYRTLCPVSRERKLHLPTSRNRTGWAFERAGSDEPAAHPAPAPTLEPPPPPDVPPTPQPTATPHIAEATPDPTPDLTTTSDPTPLPRIVVHLPGRWMNRPDAHPAQAHGDSSARNDDDESEQD